MAGPIVPAMSETHTLPTDAGEPVEPLNHVEDAAGVDNNTTGILVDSRSRTGKTPSLPKAGDGNHISTVAGIGGYHSDISGNVHEIGWLSHVVASQASDPDMKSGWF